MRKILITIVLIMCFMLIYAEKNMYNFLIGTYTSNTSSKGIYTMKLDVVNENCELKVAADKISNPSFISFSNNKEFLYSVSEAGGASEIAAFNFDKNTGVLNKINSVKAAGMGPCHITCSEKHVFTANYSSGSVCVFQRNDDGSLSEAVQVIQHQGKSINLTRQDKPHAHQVVLSPDGNFLLVNDLGTDYLTVYKYNKNSEKEALTLYEKMLVKPGAGPRHLTFSKNGKQIYLLNELDGSISHLSFKDGRIDKLSDASLMVKTDVTAGAADIHISNNGKYLYATNRANANDISCFKILKDGSLKFVQQISTYGLSPRNFVITNDDKYILVGNQKSNQITVYNVNKKSGELTKSEIKIDIQAPVCLLQY